MTEEQWLACTNPKGMLEFLRDKASDRKLRLFACACCHRIWHFIIHEAYRNLVRAAERFADGQIKWEGLRAAEQSAYDEAGTQGDNFALWAATHTASEMMAVPFCDEDVSWTHAAWAAAQSEHPISETNHAEIVAQASLLRDIFGNPFRPIPPIDPVWLMWNNATVVKIAESIYEEREFSPVRMGVLGDALEESGCAVAEVLGHCRQPKPHVKGCWVVDLILSKDR